MGTDAVIPGRRLFGIGPCPKKGLLSELAFDKQTLIAGEGRRQMGCVPPSVPG